MTINIGRRYRDNDKTLKVTDITVWFGYTVKTYIYVHDGANDLCYTLPNDHNEIELWELVE